MLLLLGAGACAISFIYTRATRKYDAPITSSKTPPPVLRPERIKNVLRAGHDTVIYPHSVIPGGVRSRDELAAAVSGDAIVATHYAGFDVGQARIIKAEETRFVHVSYRLRNKIYWTAKTVKLPRGETLITDGKSVARTRCGNKVSATPEEPISEEEPAIETFDIPHFVTFDIPQLVAMEHPELEVFPRGKFEMRPLEPSLPVKQTEISPYYFRPIFSVHPSDVVVPEPGTLGLMFSGLAVIAASRFFLKR